MKFSIPNTLLALIPLGKKTRSVPVNQISNVDTNFRLNGKSFFWGLLFTIGGIVGTVMGIIPLLILALLGIFIILNSFYTDLTIRDTSGSEIFIPVIIFQKSKAELAADQLRRIIGNRLDDTNTRIQTANAASQIVNAINNQNG